MKLTSSSEDYLEALFLLLQKENHVHSVQVAQFLNVSKPSVVKAMGILKGAGLVWQEPYGTLWLTAEGEQLARQVSQRHEMLKTFLTQILGVEEAVAEGDACKMEHSVSEETMSKLAAYMAGQMKEQK